MNAESPTTDDRLRAVLENITTAQANTRRTLAYAGDEDWLEDGESDAEYLRAIQRDTIARLDAAAQDIESLLGRRRDG